jgi:hydrogenase nickel incorporation protein HypB
MCTVCGCEDSSIEGQEHQHHHESPHHSEELPHQGVEKQATVMVVHHHHYHSDVHHHYYSAGSQLPIIKKTDAAQHDHDKHSVEPHNEHGDMHYGKGQAETHVTGVSQRRLIEIEIDVLDKNNQIALHNREHFTADKQLVLNLVSSPGSGKTTLLTETLKKLKGQRSCAVIEGDQQTANDAERIRAVGVPAIQVNTGKGCHLDAKMVHDACHQLALEKEGILFIENVGNLVCPASFDLGEKTKVAILSVTEGEDKPLKYPNMFAASGLMVINKIDLLPYVNFDVEKCIDNARRINPQIQVITLSATTGEGMGDWLEWLESNRCA